MRIMTTVDTAVFAHDEAAGIARMIADLARQDIFARENLTLRILILANGCTDDTVAESRAAIADLAPEIAATFTVLDLPQGGKSRTGHRFIHEFSRPDADLLGFMDADIRLPRTDTLRRMVDVMEARTELKVFTSRPVKDLNHDRPPTSPVARLIASGGGGLTNWRTSICGQLFVLRADMARRIGLPIGLPVEDGFIRAMTLTDLLSAPQDLSRIDGDPDIFHIYESIQTLGELLNHQTRIVIGSAINAAIFQKIRQDAPTEAAAHQLLMQAGTDAAWLPAVLRQQLPRRPHGYVPFAFLTKRFHVYRTREKKGLKETAMMLAGLGMDAIVWVKASLKMRAGTGAGHW